MQRRRCPTLRVKLRLSRSTISVNSNLPLVLKSTSLARRAALYQVVPRAHQIRVTGRVDTLAITSELLAMQPVSRCISTVPKYKRNSPIDFVDPFFSSGVHIALTGALAAATTICASMNKQVDEETAQAWHDSRVSIAHMRYLHHLSSTLSTRMLTRTTCRFLFVVLGAYYQMHAPTKLILKDIDGQSFNSAFNMFQPGELLCMNYHSRPHFSLL